MSPADWLLAWFADRGTIMDVETDYFDTGALDSLEVVELVMAVESEYDIRLTPRQFRDRRFSTVAGLAEIINEARDDG